MDQEKRGRIKRIVAWIGILLFLLLIINIFTIQYQMEMSIGAYTVLVILYLFVIRKKLEPQKTKEHQEDDNNFDKETE